MRCCSFLPTLGKLLPQKIGLCWSRSCDGSRRLNTDFCRGCCSDRWGLGCTLLARLHTCPAFIAGARWIKAGVGVFPDTTTLPSLCSADTHTCTHMDTYIGRAWNHPPLPGPLLHCCSQRSLLLPTALHIQAECHTPAAFYTLADLTMQE